VIRFAKQRPASTDVMERTPQRLDHDATKLSWPAKSDKVDPFPDAT
jgi:hypothetical protein